MSGVSADQHKFFLSHQLFNKKTIDIPPRKLLSRRANSLESSDIFSDSPKALGAAGETLFQKFLPFNCGDDDESDPYSSDHFRMFEFKVRRCTRSRSHDWTDCPFAHPGEKARRRDPRRYHYSGTVCSEYRRGGCSRGDNCEFSHGVFECWLHPARYRTEACKDGKNCKRKVCFFAHSRKQLRVLPLHSQTNGTPDVKFSPLNHCCVFCHSATSPTSTLMGTSHFSPPASPSPPLSPVNPTYSPISRYNDRSTSLDSSNMSQFRHVMLSYNKDVVAELMSSLEAININEASPEHTNPLVDSCFASEDHQQFSLSPSIPNASGSRHFFNGDCSSKSSIEDKLSSENGSWACPDLGWVNDLLM
ncbi:Zinc finger CCCH domain-containing protein 2 [Vitis vinifera]|uniref:Zinc finger CCCH domain-containing protein 2 n=2 Tax=Vitis vinifera TaxID=29760 RepID=A0A438EGL8_VITVI|nr:Zinc finger CCCH domain-containing protein 2 [Vitis vinifera]